MKEYSVTCTVVKDGRIVEIGGPAGGGWRLSEEEIIKRLQRVPQDEAFFTEAFGQRAYIGVYGHPPNQHLRTFRNSQWQDNLDSLSACPVSYPRIA